MMSSFVKLLLEIGLDMVDDSLHEGKGGKQKGW